MPDEPDVAETMRNYLGLESPVGATCGTDGRRGVIIEDAEARQIVDLIFELRFNARQLTEAGEVLKVRVVSDIGDVHEVQSWNDLLFRLSF